MRCGCYRQNFLLRIVLLCVFWLTYTACVYSKEIFIFSFNDLHGYSDESKNALGFAKFASGLNNCKKSLGATQENSVVVAAGDLYQGGFLSNISHGGTVSPFFNAIGVKLSAVGNHDLDWGIEHFKHWEQDGGLKFLSANLRGTNGGSIFEKYKILELAGYKVAFIGFTTTESAFTVPNTALSSAGGLVFDNAAVVAKELVREVRAKYSPDYIIALSHIGAVQDNGIIYGHEIEELSMVDGIDAIIAGHTHTNVAGMLNGKAVVEACSYGKCIGVLTINTDTHTIVPAVKDLHSERSSIIADGAVDKIVKSAATMYEKEATTVFATASRDLTFKEVSEYFVEKIFKRYSTEQNVDAVIINGGLFRTKIAHGEQVSYKTIKELIPFDNTLVFIEISGADLRKAMRHTHNMPNERKSGAFYTMVKKIKSDKYYKVAISSFMYPRGDWYDFTGAKNVFDTGTLLSDLMSEFVGKYGI